MLLKRKRLLKKKDKADLTTETDKKKITAAEKEEAPDTKDKPESTPKAAKDEE